MALSGVNHPRKRVRMGSGFCFASQLRPKSRPVHLLHSPVVGELYRYVVVVVVVVIVCVCVCICVCRQRKREVRVSETAW